MSTYLIEAPPIFKTRVATELFILSLDVSAAMFEMACRQYNLGNICDQTMHVEGISVLKLTITFFINFCCLDNGLSSLPMSFPPAWMTRNLGCGYFDRKSQMISATLSKLNPDTPFHNTDTLGNERSVPNSVDSDAYCSALLIRDDPTIHIESTIS